MVPNHMKGESVMSQYDIDPQTNRNPTGVPKTNTTAILCIVAVGLYELLAQIEKRVKF